MAVKSGTLDTEKSIYSETWALVLFALIACALWGSAFPGVKIGYELFNITDVGSRVLFAGYRFTLAGVFTLIAVSIINGGLVKISPKHIPHVFAQGILQTTVQYILFYIGLANTTGVKGSVINGSNAFFSIIAAPFLIKGERLTVKKIIGCLIGFLGVIAVNLTGDGFGGGFTLQGEGFILICAATYGISSVTQKMLAKYETPNAITAYQLIMGGLVLIITGFALGGHVTGFNLKSTGLLIYLALLSTVAFTLWANLLKHNTVSRVTIFGFTIPVFGSLLSAMLLGESFFNLTNLAALILVCIGIIIVNYSGKANR